MHVATYTALLGELQKVKEASGNFGHAAELAGLGMLAAPTIQKMRGKPMKDKNKDRAEIGGLGVLAAPSAIGLGKSLMGKMKGVGKVGLNIAKHASVTDSALSLFQEKKAGADLWNPTTGHLLGEAASKVRAMGAATRTAKAVKTDGHELLKQMKSMKGHTGTLNAAAAKPKMASFTKEALFGLNVGSAAKAVAKTPFKPSFAGHAKALGLGMSTAKNGVTTARDLSLGAKNGISQKKFIEIPGLS